MTSRPLLILLTLCTVGHAAAARADSAALDVDRNGEIQVNTDLVYVANCLRGLPAIPDSFRQQGTLPTDQEICARVTLLGSALDVDGDGVVGADTDVLYIARLLIGLAAVPPSVREGNPPPLSDDQIAARVETLSLPVPDSSTATATLTWTATHTETPTPVLTDTVGATSTQTQTLTPKPTDTATATRTVTLTPTPTTKSTDTFTPTRTLTPTPTAKSTDTSTPTRSYTPTVTPTRTRTATWTVPPPPSSTATFTLTPTLSPTPDPTLPLLTILLVGECRQPGPKGPRPCALGTTVRAYRCSDFQCLVNAASRIFLGTGAVDDKGSFSIIVQRSSESDVAALSFDADVTDGEVVKYRAIARYDLGGGGNAVAARIGLGRAAAEAPVIIDSAADGAIAAIGHSPMQPSAADVNVALTAYESLSTAVRDDPAASVAGLTARSGALRAARIAARTFQPPTAQLYVSDNGYVYQVIDNSTAFSLSDARVTTVAGSMSGLNCTSEYVVSLSGAPALIPLAQIERSDLLNSPPQPPCFDPSGQNGDGSLCLGLGCTDDCQCPDTTLPGVGNVPSNSCRVVETVLPLNFASPPLIPPASLAQFSIDGAQATTYGFGLASGMAPTVSFDFFAPAPSDGFTLPVGKAIVLRYPASGGVTVGLAGAKVDADQVVASFGHCDSILVALPPPACQNAGNPSCTPTPTPTKTATAQCGGAVQSPCTSTPVPSSTPTPTESMCSPAPLPAGQEQVSKQDTTIGRPNASHSACGGGDASDAAFTFVAPSTGLYQFDTVGSAFDTVLSVRSGGCGGVEVACDDDSGGAFASALTLSLFQSQQVTVIIDGFGSSAGPFSLQIKRLDTDNLLQNPSFEDGQYDPAGAPIAWIRDASNATPTFTWDSDVAHDGSKSVRIDSVEPSDARWVQTVVVDPNTDYRLSGWIKTEAAGPTVQAVDAGANFSILDCFPDPVFNGCFLQTRALLGTNDWTRVFMVFNSASLTQVRVAARLGMYSGETTGRAWFDQLRLEKVQPTPTPPPECQVVDQPTCTPVIRPDLVVTNVTAPATGVIGGFVNVGVQIFNQGEGNADPAQIDFYYSTDNVITGDDRHSGYFCTRESIGGLNSGGTGGCAGGIGVPADLAPGFYYVGAIVDGDEKVSETDETNNSRAAVGPILLSAPEAPAAFDRARSLAPADPTTGTGAVQGIANAARRAPIAYGSGQPMAAPNSP